MKINCCLFFMLKRLGRSARQRMVALACALGATLPVAAAASEPVLIGLDEAYSIATNTAPKAIERGMRAAIAEINARGGVLGGRQLQLVTTDNQAVAARGKDNFIDLAGRPGMTAVFGGKFSPVTVETVPEANRLKVPLVSVWGSADQITDGDPVFPFVFRLSLKDSWGVEALVQRARDAYKASRLCILLPNTAWGRSADKVLASRASAMRVTLASVRWYNWGDSNFADHVAGCQQASAKALVMVANEREGALVLGEIAKLPAAQRLPVVAHWGITGGALHTLVGDALSKVDMQIIQTFTFIDNRRPAAQRLAAAIMKEGGFASVKDIHSPVGSAHGYDMTHLLALAINKAGSTEGDALRQALERLPAFDGAVRRYEPAFTPTRHDALTAREVLFVRMEQGGALVPVK
jgi:branched-chain amino acid transport system substrate-binding protein